MARPDPMTLSVLDALEEPALVVERERVELANSAAQSVLGRQIVGRDLRLAIRHPHALDLILRGQAAETELVGIGGSERPWNLRVRPIDGARTLVLLSDRSALRTAERMRTDFVANASHELRTPLATIVGYAETLAEDLPVDDATRARFGSTIEAEARRMQRIVEDLMSLSRIEADRFRAPDEAIDLGEVVRLSVEHASSQADRRGCRIVSSIAADLPSAAGDFGQLQQMMDNLIGNAVRYGCTEKARSVEVEVASERSRIVLRVRDHGEGIAAEHLPRLTERFYRIDPARSRESGGTGLGLAIVKHIVERHRGSLDIESAVGRGTMVTVYLPVAGPSVIKR